MRISTKLALASVSLISLSTPVYAADAAADDAKNDDAQIVVTGTLIRGTQATGSQTLTVDATAIKQVAAASTNELLAAIPQIGSFNARPEGNPRGLTAVAASVRPNLRGFPSTNATSGALTLIMVDGLRITPTGANSSSVDADLIPSAVLAGVDIVTDGGSSLYGADAVAGVMNFRTLKTFEGVKLDGNFGFGDRIKGFHTMDGSVTVGKSWSTGNAYVSVSHADRDAVLNKQTPWANGIVTSTSGVNSLTGTECNTPQPTIMRYVYVASFGVWTNNVLAGAGAKSLGTGCDQILDGTYLPSLKRTSAYGSISNSFSDSVDLRITGYWSKRDIGLPGYALGYTSASPAITPPSGVPGSAGAPASSPVDFAQGVGFAFGPNSAYVNTPSKITTTTWGVTPELTLKLGSNWSVRTAVHFGRSNDATHFPGVNKVQTQCYITGCTGVTAGQINPLNIAAASASVIADVTNWETAQQTTHELFMARAVADGTLFALPAGDAKVAIGAEFQNNKDATRITTGKLDVLATLPYKSYSRNVKSFFGEVHLPVTDFADVAGSLRYDSYSDFGDTVNPNLGLSLKPASWLKVYGHWGTSYNAPTAYDGIGVGLGRSGNNYTPGAAVGSAKRPTVAAGKTDNQQGSYFIVLTGVSPTAPLKPQTSNGWALGFDVTPTAGLTFGAEFYSIHLKNALGSINPANTSFYQTNPANFLYNNELTANGGALFNTIMSQLSNGAAVTNDVGGAAGVAIIVDTRTSNINDAKVEGLDFHINFEKDTSIGHVSFGTNGNVRTRARITTAGAITNELAHGDPRLTAATYLGLRTEGGFSTKLTVNYSGMYHDNSTNSAGIEADVNPFIVTNLAIGYDFKNSDSVLKGLSLRANVDNLFNVSPQVVLRPNTNSPNFNGWTLGRVFKVGGSFKF